MNIRCDAQLAQRVERDRGLAKGKQPGHGGESGLLFGHCGIRANSQNRGAQHRHGRSRDGALVFEADIDASHTMDGTEQVPGNDAISELALEGDGLFNLRGA